MHLSPPDSQGRGDLDEDRRMEEGWSKPGGDSPLFSLLFITNRNLQANQSLAIIEVGESSIFIPLPKEE